MWISEMWISEERGLQGRHSWEMAKLHIHMGQRGDVVFLHLPTLLGRRRRVAQLAGCSQVLRYSEMLKHFFDTEQGPLGVSSVSISHAG